MVGFVTRLLPARAGGVKGVGITPQQRFRTAPFTYMLCAFNQVKKDSGGDSPQVRSAAVPGHFALLAVVCAAAPQ